MDEFMNMFEKMMPDFLNTLSFLLNLKSETIARNMVETEDGIIYDVSTIWASDTNKCETAIRADYNNKRILEWVVVEYYDTKEEAESGHVEWMAKLENETPTCFFSVQDKHIYMFEIVS